MTLIEAIQNRAANATQVSRIDRKEAERIFNEFRMSGRDYLKFKKQMNLNHINALRAGCEIRRKRTGCSGDDCRESECGSFPHVA